MENKIIILALKYPQDYPWKKENLGTTSQILSILTEADINTLEKRRIAYWDISNIIFETILNINTKKELEYKILENLNNKNYICEEVLDSILNSNYLLNDSKIEIYKKFVKNTLTLEEKLDNKNEIILWIIELFTYYNVTLSDVNINVGGIREQCKLVFEKYFPELKVCYNDIKTIQAKKGFVKSEVLQLFKEKYHTKNEEFKTHIEQYFNPKQEETPDKDLNFTDDTIENIIVNEIGVAGNSAVIADKIQNEIVESTQDIETEKKETIVSKQQSLIDNKLEASDYLEYHLHRLCSHLGYKIYKENTAEIEQNEFSLLKELVSPDNSFILSQLYNAYCDIENISKGNLEAIISNFFTILAIKGFEPDTSKAVGEKCRLDAKNILKEFLLSSPIGFDGEIDVEIEYLGWTYKGKKVIPMIVKQSK